MPSFLCRDGWLRGGGGLWAVQTEAPREHENVASPDPHARGSPGLRGGSNNVWYVPSRRFLRWALWVMETLSHLFCWWVTSAGVKNPRGENIQATTCKYLCLVAHSS